MSRHFRGLRLAVAKSTCPFATAVIFSAIFACGGCIGLMGSGNASGLSASARSVNFGSVSVGSPTSELVTVTNKSLVDATILAKTSGSGFSLSGTSNLALTPNQSVNLYVNFNPTAAGAVTGVLSVASSASPTPLKIALAATGVAAQQQHSVMLQWSSSSSPVIGYFVYRSSAAAGSYAKLNTSPKASTSYTDNSVANGATYYYAVTSVNANNVESGYSGQVSVTIPSN